MTEDDALYRFRLRVFALAQEPGNARAACRAMGIHPSTYYRWRRQLLRFGPEIPAPPRAPVPADAERDERARRAAGPRLQPGPPGLRAGPHRRRTRLRALGRHPPVPQRGVAHPAPPRPGHSSQSASATCSPGPSTT
jgi:hypothetical protein